MPASLHRKPAAFVDKADAAAQVFPHPDIAERAQHRVVETRGAFDLYDAEGNVMEHVVEFLGQWIDTARARAGGVRWYAARSAGTPPTRINPPAR